MPNAGSWDCAALFIGEIGWSDKYLCDQKGENHLLQDNFCNSEEKSLLLRSIRCIDLFKR
ncbi:hypothetical protein DC081_04400 [Ignatzschineria cameli]|uniref:Uncharacterized protein n=1 Tax=Ignatzschineria cameli TaxID=2182793 RepID=A0A2U2AT28_9GAMM|nr:hypothetical protein DC080_03935 [Ignatzschineria cameli]PWD87872.1 hypothetical protein DC077_00900 [Ignatzschineria cameli]PWD90440.1 hypothetical protein DC079_04690 [Ignatzschineria cameli]PWD92324.1 hypothetical protein DC081_04400 [Ignatzschineria cameli]PWD93117.1 hypothetical protein DC078_04690 [Ignatzschineria cameli]